MNTWQLLVARWQGISKRERQWVLVALTLVLAALMWWLGVAPALSTLRSAENQRRLLDAQLQQMQSLQAQAKAMQAQPKITSDEARRLLEASVKPFGAAAQLTSVGDRTLVTLKGASADALAQWLLQVRLNVHSVPSDARLVRAGNGTWDGTLTLNFK
jgi:general secretion pathway protein M